MRMFDAEAWPALADALKATGIEVPGRIEGRKSWHRERHDICLLLSALGACGQLTFPLRVEKRESPDFELEHVGMKIGIEHVTSCDEDYERARTRQERVGGSLRLHAVGRSPERRWVELIFNSVARKLAKLNEPKFSRYGTNWLLVHDNNPWSGSLHLDFAILRLSEKMADLPRFPVGFDRVFIKYGGEMLEFCGALVARHPIKNLWN